MSITANGLPCLAGMINEPETGPWTGRVEVDDEIGAAFESGLVTVTTGLVTWVGTVRFGSIEQGRYVAEIVGGQNKLETVIDAKSYYQTTLLSIVTDILAECGEVIDPESAANLTALVPHWVRAKGQARVALQAVCNEINGFWRVTRAGLVLITASDTYAPIADLPVEEDRDPSKNTVVIAPDEPYARPGVSVGADRIVTALTQWDGGKLRQVLQVHDDTENAQDMAGMLAELARRTNELRAIYSKWYPCKVVAQDADGTLQIYPEDETVRGSGIAKVPLMIGMPGVKVTVAPGARVRLFFENGDPSKPACALWEQSSTAAQAFVLGNVLQTVLAALTVPTAMGPSGTPINSATFSTFLSATHKLDS